VPAEEAPSEEAASLVGSTIGDRYVIDAILGEGGMGRVYLAHHKVIEKKLAIKILHAELVKDKEAVGRFIREAKAASSIGNSHIVDISDFGELPDGSTYFVMEYLDGHTLAGLMEQHGALPFDLVCDVALQTCDGLAAAHAQEIVHRDLKPENITLVKRGEHESFVKILDFGIAKVSSRETKEKLTVAGAVFGTPHYMSPEQAAGAAVDQRTDIYSLGVMLYEMVSGELPFNADNFMGILTQHMYKAPVPIRVLAAAPDCSPGLEAVILKCLSKSPDARYQSMEELAADIQRVQAGAIPSAVQEMVAREGSFSVPAGYFSGSTTAGTWVPNATEAGRKRTSPRAAIAIGVLLAVALATVVIVYHRLTTAEGPSGPATSAPTTAAADATTAPHSVAASAVKKVHLRTDKVDAIAIVDGEEYGLPTRIEVPEGQTVTVEIRPKEPGYLPETITLDGSTDERVVALKPDPSARPESSAEPRTASTAARSSKSTSRPPATTRAPRTTTTTTTTGGVIDPWDGR